MVGKINKKPDGTFVKGEPSNPEGTNGHKVGWQPFGIRAQHWLNKLSMRELRLIADSDDELDKLSSYDAMVVTALVDALFGKERGKERERVLDRIEGKAVSKTELSGPDGGDIPLTTNTTELAQEGKNALAFLLQRMVDEQKKNKTEK